MRAACLLAPLLLLGACATDDLGEGDGDPIDGTFELGKADGSAPSAAEIVGVLALVNTASLAVLDDDAALDARAARNIVAHRDGPDGDFDDLAELDAVPYVGAVALARLVAHAYALDLVPDDAPAAACLLISEYGEGHGNYNKAIEIYNCGAAPLDLGGVGVCLVRDGAVGCSVADGLAGTLAPGAVETICRRDSGHPASTDPSPALIAACHLERPGVMSFSGNDRLVLFGDDDRSGTRSADEPVLDAFGQIARAPRTELWSNVNLRRYRLEAFDGASFFPYRDYFAIGISGNDFSHFGIAPTASDD